VHDVLVGQCGLRRRLPSRILRYGDLAASGQFTAEELDGGPNTAADPRTTVENILIPRGHFDIAEDPDVIDIIVNRIHPPLDKPK
jgi:hypothetical protein